MNARVKHAPPTRPRLRRALHILVAAGAALSAVDMAPAAVQTFGGFSPSVASYSTDAGMEGDVASIPITLGMRVRRLSLRAVVPYLELQARTPEITLPGPTPGIVIPAQSIDETGIGDVVFTPALLLAGGGPRRSSLWGSVRVKLPTADEERHLGTGQTDYAPGIGVLVPLGSRFTAGALVRYEVRGDTADIQYDDHVGAVLGGIVRLGFLDALTAMVSRGDVGNDRGDTDTFSLAWYHPLGRGTAFTATALTSLGGDRQTQGLSLGVTFNDGPYDWGR